MNSETEHILVNSSLIEEYSKSQKLEPIETTIQKNIESLSNICRTCANITEFVIPIFIDEGLQNNLADKIEKHLPIKVSEYDSLPHVVCYQCASTLLAWHDLVQCCIQADTDLRKRFAARTNKSEPNVSTDQSQEPLAEKDDTNVSFYNLKNENIIENDSTTQDQLQLVTNSQSITSQSFVQDNSANKYIRCYYCTKNIPSSSWKQHMRSHQSAKKYSCHVCGLGFNDKSNLSRHTQASHNNSRPHACHVCNKRFFRKTHLSSHIESHSKNRNYVCDVCGKSSKSSVALRMHKKMHESSFKFHCVFCEARFKRKSQLIAHVLVHTGEKAHICDCGKAFRLRAQLNSHMKTHIPKIVTFHD